MIDIKNKKGMIGVMLGLIGIIIVSFIAVVFFSLMRYGINLADTQLLNVTGIVNINATNLSDATRTTFSKVNEGMSGLRTISFIIILGFIIGTIIIGFYSQKNPVWFFIYFLFLILAIIFSVYISNAYETLTGDPTFGSFLTSNTASNYFILHLPIVIAVIGFISIFLMLAGMYIQRSAGGL